MRRSPITKGFASLVAIFCLGAISAWRLQAQPQKQGDDWLAQYVPMILSSAAY